jgi:7,8-dihydropterin-6-yl-methyl-4-(beta-D-ribofuranosyl)aminobenzene 5'-phosphate synthase
MSDKITILTDNRAEEPLKSEHGFSLLIEKNDIKILFDTGQGDSLFLNAALLGIPLDNLDILVLSHGHYDHGGNIKKILEMNPNIDFYAHPDCLEQRYSHHEGKPIKSVSLTEENSRAIKNLSEDQIHWCLAEREISPGVWITGSIPRSNDYEDTGGAFFTDTSMKKADLLHDDMSLWIEKKDSLTIVCGCCHSGLQNTVEKILSLSQKNFIKTIIGGMHLVNANTTRINKTVNYINSINVGEIIGAHCTGEKAVTELKSQLNSRISMSSAGLILEF